VLQLGQLDVIPTDLVYADIKEDPEEGWPLSDHFQEFGFDSVNCIVSMGSTTIYLFANAIIFILTVAFKEHNVERWAIGKVRKAL
jgi:hypothetical protein